MGRAEWCVICTPSPKPVPLASKKRLASKKVVASKKREPRFCEIKDCGAKHCSKGLCRSHYDAGRKRDAERMRQYTKAYYRANTEKCKAYGRQYSKAWYAAHRETKLPWQREYERRKR